jgi:hypothetical protein
MIYRNAVQQPSRLGRYIKILSFIDTDYSGKQFVYINYKLPHFCGETSAPRKNRPLLLALGFSVRLGLDAAAAFRENLQKSPHDAVLTHLGPEGEERSPLFSMAPLIFSKFYFARIPRIQRLAGHKIWKFIFWTLLGSLNSAEDSPLCHEFSFSERKFVIHSSKRHCV